MLGFSNATIRAMTRIGFKGIDQQKYHKVYQSGASDFLVLLDGARVFDDLYILRQHYFCLLQLANSLEQGSKVPHHHTLQIWH